MIRINTAEKYENIISFQSCKFIKDIRLKYILILFSALVIQTQANAESESSNIQYKVGEQAYMNHCANCHGVKGKGDGPNANQLASKPTDLTLLSEENGGSFPETAVYNIIDGRRTSDYHGQEMPIWGQYFKDQENDEDIVDAKINSLIEYLISIQVE